MASRFSYGKAAGQAATAIVAIAVFWLADGSCRPAEAQAQRAVGPAETQPASVLTLQEALDRALSASPRIDGAKAGEDAARGAERQAAAIPNPELAVEIENFEGNGPYEGMGSAELTYGLTQEIEVGGKRSARRRSATAERQAAELISEATRLDLIRDVTTLYVEAVAADQSFELAKELEGIAQRVLQNVTERVNAAREPLVQQSKAEVAATTSSIARQRAANAREAARQSLARAWGDGMLSDRLSSAEFFERPEPQHLDAYSTLLRNSPDILRLTRIQAAREADVRAARAEIVPNPTLSLGVRQFRETDRSALIAGVSLPLPVFNQNSGAIRRSRGEARMAESELRQGERDLAGQLLDAWTRWRSAATEATSLAEVILPQADKAFRLTLEGYRAGRFQFLEVLDAQRTLFEARAEHVSALAQLHIAQAQVERLIAAHRSNTTE